MIIDRLLKRSPRERWILTAAFLALVIVACYVAAVAPSLEALTGARNDLHTIQTNLELQQRQLNWLRAETAASKKALAKLQDVPCPWVPATKADAVIQEFQKQAADLGLSVRSVTRERVVTMKLKDAPVALLFVRLEMSGSHASVMEILRRLSKGPLAIGLEELSIRGSDEPPYDVGVMVLVRLPVLEGANNG
jgi:type II secretory pathway component PulM